MHELTLEGIAIMLKDRLHYNLPKYLSCEIAC